MRPLIGITLDILNHKNKDDYTQGITYTQAVSDAGGNPILLSPYSDVDWIKNNLDGLLIPGGLDLLPESYNEPPHPLSYLQNPLRYHFEKKLYEAIPKNMPVLGICYGCQFMNVMHGGSLIQHLPDVIHSTDHQSNEIFTYNVALGSKLHKIFDDLKVQGESYHHQAVKKLGVGLSVSAYSEDGVVEAIETTDEHWRVGVQWHPERTLVNSDSRKLFDSFVKASILFKENH